ncbi:hypothetical protein SDJN02_14548, partial [Cucurbita argyrosperma subsp. argyrosperma]
MPIELGNEESHDNDAGSLMAVMILKVHEGCPPKVCPERQSLRHNLWLLGPAFARPLPDQMKDLQNVQISLMSDIFGDELK